jgi:hypothetical protein
MMLSKSSTTLPFGFAFSFQMYPLLNKKIPLQSQLNVLKLHDTLPYTKRNSPIQICIREFQFNRSFYPMMIISFDFQKYSELNSAVNSLFLNPFKVIEKNGKSNTKKNTNNDNS